MMYGKAMCFHDETIAKQILQTDDVTRIKELGRLVSNYNDQIWSGMRQIIVYEGLVEKFSQNQELSDALLNTGDAFFRIISYCLFCLFCFNSFFHAI